MGNNDKLNTHLPVDLLNETLEHIIKSSPQCSSFKHSVSKKYLLVNQALVEKIAIPRQSIIGHTFQDLMLRKSCKLDNHVNIKLAKEVNQLDQYVCERKKTISSEKNIFSTQEGVLLVENYIKIPIFDQPNSIAGILSYIQDITPQCDLFSLLQIYQAHYSTAIASKSFLKYLKIEHYFTQTPTPRELMSLLAMFLDNSHKHVAKLLAVKAKTAETHIYQLKSKLRGVSLTDILKIMRSSNRNTFARKETLE